MVVFAFFSKNASFLIVEGNRWHHLGIMSYSRHSIIWSPDNMTSWYIELKSVFLGLINTCKNAWSIKLSISRTWAPWKLVLSSVYCIWVKFWYKVKCLKWRVLAIFPEASYKKISDFFNTVEGNVMHHFSMISYLEENPN